jgi:NitT/TauT family transport system permease protein
MTDPRAKEIVPTDLLAVSPTIPPTDDEEVDDLQLVEPLPAERRWLAWTLIILTFAALMALWFYVSGSVSPIVFPSPGRVWNQFVTIAINGDLVENLLVTLTEILLGFVVGSAFGIGLGAILARSRLAQRIANPYLIATQAMPKLALAPMLVLWFGFGITSKVVIAALIAFFPLLENTIVGLREVPRDELRLFESLSATERQTFTKLRIPNAMPYIFAGLRVAMLFATVGAVVGEYVGANVGLGALIIVSYGTLNTALMFAVMIVLTIMGIVLYKAVEYAERWWRRIPE